MPNFFKRRQRKGPRPTTGTPSQSVTPSTSTLTSAEQSDLAIEEIDWALEIAGIVGDISDGIPLLAPLKATCALITRVLELVRDTHYTRLDSEEMTELLQSQKREMEIFAARPHTGDMNGTPTLRSKLESYLKTVQDALAETTVPAKEPKHKRFGLLRPSRPTTSAQEETSTLKQNLSVSYRVFMDALLLVASNTVENNTHLPVNNAKEVEAETLQRREDAAVVEVEEPHERQSIHSLEQNKAIHVENHPLVDIVTSDPPARDTAKVIAAVDVAIDIALILREASEASSVLIPLKVVCTVVAKVLQNTRVSMISTYDALRAEMRNIQERLMTEVNLRSLVGHLETHYKFIEQELRGIETRERRESQYSPQQEFISALQAYLKTLDITRVEITSWNQRKQVTGVSVSSKTALGSIAGLEAELDRSFNDLLRQVHREILSMTMRATSGVTILRLSQLVKDAINARGERVKPLTPGTRLSLIERLTAWAESNESQEQIFWLHDEAGTGKSALAAHMASHWRTQGVLAGRFFFDRNGGRNLRRLDRFCITLAKEISDHHPLAQAAYLEIVDKILNPEELPFSEAFQLLVISVAEQLSKRLPKPIIFVIDALDECHEDDIQLLTSSILSTLKNTYGVRFLLTSRPTKEITSILDGISGVAGKGVVLLDVKHGETQRDHDTSIYIRQTLKDFSAMDQNMVIQCTRGVFLWATLACETLLRTITPRNVIEKFQNHTPNQTMQMLYEAALEAALPPNSSLRDLKLFHAVLQGVTLTYTPVSIFSVRTFFPGHKDETVEGEEFVEFFVKKLGSIMKDGTPFLPIYILHPTFREFIEDQKSGAKFYISPPDGHYNITVALLALLTEGLTPNVFCLDDGTSPLPVRIEYGFEPPARLSLDIEAPLRYAVAFWATHASIAIGEDGDLQQLVRNFFEARFLVWVEWSSAIRDLSECIESLRRLRWAIKVQEPSQVNGAMEKWCDDSLRFLLRNNHVIERCGLQVWMSALLFTPKNSIIHSTFSQASLRPLPDLLTDFVDTFDHSRVLWDAKQPVFYTSFSPDGQRLLAFGLTSIRLWNARTLKLIAELKDGHQGWVHAAAFSSDGSLIASGGRDTRVCLWDGFTGAFKETLPQRHKEAIVNIDFVLCDSVVVAIDTCHQILCWSVARTKWAVHRARAMQGTMHTGEVAEIASSPDRQLFATFSVDRTIKLWDPESATAVGQPMPGSDEVMSGSFTIDGAKVIAGYQDGTMRIWDVSTQTLLHSLNSNSKPVSHIAVSPDGRLVASGGGRLCLWNINSGELACPPLERYISCLAFNQTGRRLVFGSSDEYLTVLDLRSSGEGLSTDTMTLKGHTSSINDVASSPDGRLLVSASQDGTLRAWDTDLVDISIRTDSMGHPHRRVTSLAVSRDGTRLVSAGETGDFQIWNFSTGQKVGHIFYSPEEEVNNLVFSSSNTLWASSHFIRSGGNVCIWEWQADDVAPATYTLLCRQGHITCIEFTEDRRYIVTGGMDQSVRSWNLSSRSCVANFDCASVPEHIAVSHEGRYLACASDDANLRVWDLESHQLVGSPQPGYTERPYYSYAVKFIAFSPYRAILVTRRGRKIQLFDIQDDIRCYASFEPPSSVDIPASWRPAFSLDGTYLFYGKYTFNLTTPSQDIGLPTTKLQPDRSEGLPLSTVSPLFVGEALGRIHSNRWPEALLVVPADVSISRWVAHGNMMAFGSSDGRVFIMRFPNESI